CPERGAITKNSGAEQSARAPESDGSVRGELRPAQVRRSCATFREKSSRTIKCGWHRIDECGAQALRYGVRELRDEWHWSIAIEPWGESIELRFPVSW